MSSAPSRDCYVCCAHTHTLQFLFGLFLSTGLRLHINTSGYVYSVTELKESEEFQKCILRWCSVTYIIFVLLVKKITLNKEYNLFSDWWIREKGWKHVKFASFWTLSIWAPVHSLQSHCCAHQFDLYIFPKHGCNITVAFFNMDWFQGKRGCPVMSSPKQLRIL